jgi:hypothetical protein
MKKEKYMPPLMTITAVDMPMDIMAVSIVYGWEEDHDDGVDASAHEHGFDNRTEDYEWGTITWD